jgi:hypothetical protein
MTVVFSFLPVGIISWIRGSSHPVEDGLLASGFLLCFSVPLSVMFLVSARNEVRRRKLLGQHLTKRKLVNDESYIAACDDVSTELSLAVRDSLALILEIPSQQIWPNDNLNELTNEFQIDCYGLVNDVLFDALIGLGQESLSDDFDLSDVGTVYDMARELQRVLDGKVKS